MIINIKKIGTQIPKGVVEVSGAKNSATRLLAAALIADEKVTLKYFPTQLLDVQTKVEFIIKMGGKIEIDHDKEILTIDSSDLKDTLLQDYNYPIRTTYLLVAGLLKKIGVARIPYPEGCKIGERKYDLHIMIWEKMGATVTERKDHIEIRSTGKLKTADIQFPINTIGGTENALICASIIEGTTTIKNAYISPEIEDLMIFLRSLGVEIEADGNSFIRVTGSNQLKGSFHQVMPDRIEVLTWLVFGAITRGKITIKNVPFDKMEIPLIHIKECGINFYQSKNEIIIRPDCLINNVIQPFELATGTYPGVISDMQPFFVLLGIFADGISRIHDYRYPDRLDYCEELAKIFPNQIEWIKGKITTIGRKESGKGSPPDKQLLESTDLRGSMAVLLAALASEYEITLNNVQMALRGYNNLLSKLENLGVQFQIEEQQES